MTIITLCGSTKFYTETEKAARDLSVNGFLVLRTSFYSKSRDKELFDKMTNNEKEYIIDKLVKEHDIMIDMSDGIYVINPDGYIGESTKREIEYAKGKGKFVLYLEDPKNDSKI